jgi:hypothetical protein
MALNPVKEAPTKAPKVAFVSIRNLIHRIEHVLPVDIMNPINTEV